MTDDTAVAHAAIVENSPDAIVAVDAAGMVTTCNSRAGHLLGWSPTAAPGHLLTELSPGPGPLLLVDSLIRALAGGAPAPFEAAVPHADGLTARVRVVVSPIHIGGQVAGASWTARDTGDRQALVDRIGQLERTETLGALASGVVHDVNNLLTVVLSSTELVRDDDLPDDRVRGDLAAIRWAAGHAGALTRQLLAVARGVGVEATVVDVRSTVRTVGRMIACTIGPGVRLVLPDGDPGSGLHVRVVPSRVEQLVLNLVTNAGQAMPDGGVLTVWTEGVELAAGRPGARPPLPPGRYVRLSVSDTGTGMTAGTLARAFDPFFTTGSPELGTGLGMGTVARIARDAGGGLEVDTRPGRGTTVTVWLPRCDPPGTPPGAETTSDGTEVPAALEQV